VENLDPISALLDDLLDLACREPAAVERAVTTALTRPSGRRALARLASRIESRWLRELFPQVAPIEWIRLGRAPSPDPCDTSAEAELRELRDECRAAARAGEARLPDLEKLDADSLRRLVEDEDPAELAFLTLTLPTEALARLTGTLPDPVRREVALHATRLHRLPPEVRGASAARLARDLERKHQALRAAGLLRERPPAAPVPDPEPTPPAEPARVVTPPPFRPDPRAAALLERRDLDAEERVMRFLDQENRGLARAVAAALGRSGQA
jgi:hypothetical protein